MCFQRVICRRKCPKKGLSSLRNFRMIGSLSSSPSCNFVDENKIRPEFKDLDAFLNRYNALPNL